MMKNDEKIDRFILLIISQYHVVYLNTRSKTSFLDGLFQAAINGTFNGGLRLIQGGQFHNGFFSGFVPSLGGNCVKDVNLGPAGFAVVGAALGGTTEALGGGKFANGAVTGAFTMLFNHFLHPNSEGGDDRNALKDIKMTSTGAWVASGGSALGGAFQKGSMEYRAMQDITSKIGTFSKFVSRYRVYGFASKTLGFIGSGFSVYSDTRAVIIGPENGGISPVRYFYRMGTIGTSIYIGFQCGSWQGAIIGFGIGVMSAGFEYIYDNFLTPLGNETQFQIWNLEKQFRDGKYKPGL